MAIETVSVVDKKGSPIKVGDRIAFREETINSHNARLKNPKLKPKYAPTRYVWVHAILEPRPNCGRFDSEILKCADVPPLPGGWEESLKQKWTICVTVDPAMCSVM